MSSTVTVVGNLTRDPEMRFTGSARAVASFGIACTRRYRGQGDEWQEETSFFNVTAWGDLAENVAASIGKGDRVMIHGRLVQQTWEDKTTHEKRSSVEIVADEVGPALRWATCKITRTVRESASVPAEV